MVILLLPIRLHLIYQHLNKIKSNLFSLYFYSSYSNYPAQLTTEKANMSVLRIERHNKEEEGNLVTKQCSHELPSVRRISKVLVLCQNKGAVEEIKVLFLNLKKELQNWNYLMAN